MNTPISLVENIDCMEFMKRYPDKFFELAIVDPPYGIGFGEFNRTNKDASGNRFKANKYKNDTWDDNAPKAAYFAELIRVSKNQIVWGGNYFLDLWQTPCKGFIFWYKQNPVDNFSDGEFAWTSFDKVAKCFSYKYYGNISGNTSAEAKVHPTQKPVALYNFCIENYAKPGEKILDTHLGSQSSRIAAYKLGFDFYGCEIDKDYYEQGNERFKKAIAEPLFDAVKEPEQGNIFTAAEYFEPNIFERKG
jgi:site-specific DNA-methyltransferase (adenine-specific)